MSIEKIIDLTWKEKEEVPDIAAPRVRGSFKFWLTSFKSLQNILFEFGNKLTDDMLRVIAHAHPISGELMSWKAALPADMKGLLETLKKFDS